MTYQPNDKFFKGEEGKEDGYTNEFLVKTRYCVHALITKFKATANS